MGHQTPDEVTLVKCELRTAENTIHQLQEKRRVPLPSLTDVQSPTRGIPPEILELIFNHACPSPFYFCPDTHTHKATKTTCEGPLGFPALALSHVSSQWRHVARSNPQLWTSLCLIIRQGVGHNSPSIIKTYLQNIRDLSVGLNLHIEISNTKCPVVNRTAQSIKTLLSNDAYSKSIKSLALNHPSIKWQESCAQGLSQLEYLSITEPYLDHGEENDKDEYIPSLEFHSAGGGQSAEGPAYPSFPGPITTFHHLRSLSWSSRREGLASLGALQHIQFPALHTLSWDCNRHEWLTRLLDAIESGTVCILNLKIPRCWASITTKYIFTKSHSVQELTLQCSGHRTYWLLCDFCLGLEDNTAPFFPSMRSLTIIDHYNVHTDPKVMQVLPKGYSEIILEICKKRLVGTSSCFRFCFYGRKGIEWAQGAQEELCAMIRNGLRLEVIVGEKGNVLTP